MLRAIIEMAVAGLLTYYTTFRLAIKIPAQKHRILDLFIIGFLLFALPHIIDRSYQTLNELRIIGGLICAYSYMLLVIYSFKEGYKEGSRPQG